MRTSPGLRKWLTMVAALDVNYRSIWNMTQLDEMSIVLIENKLTVESKTIEISEFARLKNQVFNNHTCRHLQKV